MKRLKSRRMLWGLAAVLVIVAVVPTVLGLVRDDGSSVDKGETPLAYRSSSNGPTDKLISDLQERLKVDPEDSASHINLANVYTQKVRETGDPSLYTKAEDLLDRAEEIEPQSAELFAARGILALARHDFDGALKLGKQALILDPESARFHGIVGDAQIELGMYDEAIDSYQEMIDGRPDFASYSRVAYARELHGDPEGAIEAMQLAVDAGSSAPENTAWAYIQLGNLLFNLGDLEEAAENYDLSLKTLADYPLALAGQARISAATGDLEEAASLYQQAFDRVPTPEHAILLGDVYAKMGDQQKAEEQYEMVRAIDEVFQANGVNTDLELALFYADQDLELQTSLEKARSAYEERPSIHAADVLAWTLYKTGDYQEARQYASEALKLDTRDPLKLFHAGMIEKALGENEQAEQYLRQAIGLNPHFSLLYGDLAAAELKDLGANPATTSEDS